MSRREWTFWDADGHKHELLVRRTEDGDWQVLDSCAKQTRVIDTLDRREDGRAQAEAIVRDYLETGGRTALEAGPADGHPIPVGEGANA